MVRTQQERSNPKLRTTSRIPGFKTIEEEAEFWDAHSLAEFEDEIEEVSDVIFVEYQPKKVISVRLGVDEIAALNQRARADGVSRSMLVRSWIVDRLRHQGKERGAKR